MFIHRGGPAAVLVLVQAAKHTQTVGTSQQAGQLEPSVPGSAAAVISWDRFKSRANPGDKLTVTGHSPAPAAGINLGQPVSHGVVTPAATGMLLVTDADVAQWVADASMHSQVIGDGAWQPRDASAPPGEGVEDASKLSGNASQLPGIAGGGAADGDRIQWSLELEAAGSQAEKLLLLAQVICSAHAEMCK